MPRFTPTVRTPHSRTARFTRTALVGLALVAAGVVSAGVAAHTLAQTAPGFPTQEPRRAAKPALQLGPEEFSIVIEAAKQGRLKGDGVRTDNRSGGKDDDGVIVGLAYAQEVKIPTSGKRAHGPVVLTKLVGPSSGQILNAVSAGEKLKTVWLQFQQPTPGGPRGSTEFFFTITLTNADIESVRTYTKDGRTLEDLTLRFERIDIEHTPSKSSGTDSTR